MNNDILKKLLEIEDELTRLNKKLNWQLYNLDGDNIPVLGEYSRLISENKAALSVVSQTVSDTQASVSLLAQYTGMDNVAVVESSDDKSDWDTSLVYYDSITRTYWYHDGEKWTATDNPVTAGLDTTIAQIQAKADKNESSITSLTSTVTSQGTALASVTQKANANASSITSLTKSVNTNATNIASVTQKANANASSIESLTSTVSSHTSSISSISLKTNTNESNITLLSQFTAMDDVVTVTSASDTGSWDTSKIYYVSSSKRYCYYDTERLGGVWRYTTNPITAGVSSTIATIETKAEEASASVAILVANLGDEDGEVTAASIVAAINEAGSTVQIAADHISLDGKTIALTTNDINITSTYFNVSTAGEVACTALEVTGGNSSITMTSSNYSVPLITVLYDSLSYAELSPAILQVSDYNNYGFASVSNNGFSKNGYSNGYIENTEITHYKMSMYTEAKNNDDLYVYLANDVWGVSRMDFTGSFVVNGTKSCLEKTEHYGGRLMYAYETPTPMYSDFGRGTIAEDGICMVFVDPLFYECVDNAYDYFVFLQPESGGSVAVRERNSEYFVIEGEPGASFAWMIATPQKGYSATRCEEYFEPEPEPMNTPNTENIAYDSIGDSILKEFDKQIG